LASGRADRTSRPLRLECLEIRITPATATWNGPANGDWKTPANWSWSDNTYANNYPGDTFGRADDVKFDNTSVKNAVLDGDLGAYLNSLKLTNLYTGNVTLNGNVDVGGNGGFVQGNGTATIGAGKTLELDKTSLYHSWDGGLIAGAGTLKVYDTVLFVDASASSLGANLVIGGTVSGGGGTVWIGTPSFPMNGNLALSGDGNTISVQANGTLSMRQDLAAVDANLKGGITGGSSHVITVSAGGVMSRGKSDKTSGGSVLVDVPVQIDGGTFQLYEADATKQKDVIKFSSAFVSGPNGGYDVALTNSYSTFIQAVHTDVIATHGVVVNALLATYQVSLNANSGAAGQSLIGNLTFLYGGFLKLLDAVNGTTGTFGITGNLILAGNTDVNLNWNATSADVISVTGTATLAGYLNVSGVGPAQATSETIISATNVVGSFGIYTWTGGNGTISGYLINTDSTFIIQWN
jgi:hypothetical protein